MSTWNCSYSIVYFVSALMHSTHYQYTCFAPLFNPLSYYMSYIFLFIYSANPCNVNPCLNGGICQRSDNNGYDCFCLPPYEGPTCAICEFIITFVFVNMRKDHILLKEYSVIVTTSFYVKNWRILMQKGYFQNFAWFQYFVNKLFMIIALILLHRLQCNVNSRTWEFIGKLFLFQPEIISDQLIMIVYIALFSLIFLNL